MPSKMTTPRLQPCRKQWMTALWLFAVLAIALISGCAVVPDVSGFADQTASLHSSAGGELTEVDRRFDLALKTYKALPSEIRDGESDNRGRTIENQATLKATRKSAAKLLDGISAYSEDLVALVNARDDGKGAAKTIFANVNAIAGIAAPGTGPVIGGMVATAGEQILEAVNKIQVAANLREAIIAAHPGMVAAGEALQALYGPRCPADPEARKQALADKSCEIWERGIRAIGDRHADWLKLAAGRQSIEFYERAALKRDDIYGDLKRVINRDDVRHFCSPEQGKPLPKNCLTDRQQKALQLLEERMEAIRPAVVGYHKAKKEIVAWEAVRVNNADVVRTAVRAWVAEHRKLRDMLQNCDFTVLGACARVSGGGIKAALERLETVGITSE